MGDKRRMKDGKEAKLHVREWFRSQYNPRDLGCVEKREVIKVQINSEKMM